MMQLLWFISVYSMDLLQSWLRHNKSGFILFCEHFLNFSNGAKLTATDAQSAFH